MWENCAKCGALTVLAETEKGPVLLNAEPADDGRFSTFLHYSGKLLAHFPASSATKPSWRRHAHVCVICTVPERRTAEIKLIRVAVARREVEIGRMRREAEGGCCPTCMFGSKYTSLCDRQERAEAWLRKLLSSPPKAHRKTCSAGVRVFWILYVLPDPWPPARGRCSPSGTLKRRGLGVCSETSERPGRLAREVE